MVLQILLFFAINLVKVWQIWLRKNLIPLVNKNRGSVCPVKNFLTSVFDSRIFLKRTTQHRGSVLRKLPCLSQSLSVFYVGRRLFILMKNRMVVLIHPSNCLKQITKSLEISSYENTSNNESMDNRCTWLIQIGKKKVIVKVSKIWLYASDIYDHEKEIP